jgi:hypothetical protein
MVQPPNEEDGQAEVRREAMQDGIQQAPVGAGHENH